MTDEPIKSVLHGVQEAAGAEFMEDGGWVWTTTFGDAEAEYTAVRENAGMWDVYGLQKWDVTGPDAAAAVQRTFTGDVARIAVGQVKYGPFVAEDGLMADDGTVYKHADDHFWVFTNSTTFADFLASKTADLDYRIENRTFAMPVISVQGPRSREILQGLTDADLSSLRYFHFLPERQTVAGVTAWVLRTGYSGELGFELIPDAAADAVELWEALGQAGVQPFGLDAVELLRVEAGLVMVGVEFQGGDVSPYDLSLDRSVLLGSDAEFIGRPALAAVAADPPNRLKTLVVQGDTVPEYGAEVFRGEEVVGTLTSPVASPRFGVIGLAVLRTDQAVNGTVLEVPVEGGRVKATVADASIHDPDKKKPRS
jgi:aminomethyltransferase